MDSHRRALLQAAVATPAAAALPAAAAPAADVDLVLTAAPGEARILDGPPTGVWQFRARLDAGGGDSVQPLGESYLGPTLRLRHGQSVRVRFDNGLPQPSIVHWHGMLVPDSADGHPRLAIAPGAHYEYRFDVRNRAGTYWYHPHPHGLTGPQVYGGLAGLLIVHDDEERSLGLPAQEHDLALVLQDRLFGPNNRLVYDGGGTGMGRMMSGMLGFFGDTVLVNGRAGFAQEVERRAYRLRLLNGSNARIYRLAFGDGRAMAVIGTDGGLLPQPLQRRAVTLAPGERIELWVDFSGDRGGSTIALVSEAFDAGNGAGMGGMMRPGMMGGGHAAGQGAPLQLARFLVRSGAAGADRLPARLAALPPLDAAAAFSGRERVFRLQGAHMRWTINGRTYQHDEVADDEIVRLGTAEVWAFENFGGMGMMGAQPHPMHVHGVQFRVLERRMSTPAAAYWQRLREGLVDQGFKDTVLVLPGERVRVQVRFDAHAGLFLYHCHNLEHEDMGMMRSFRIDA